MFMDNSADYGSVPWIIDEFSNVWEDAYGEFLWSEFYFSGRVVVLYWWGEGC